MSDPFASLLTSFKNGPKKEDRENGASYKVSTESQGTPAMHLSARPATPSVPSGDTGCLIPMNSSIGTLNGPTHDDLDELFGLKSQDQQKPLEDKKTGLLDDIDAAFSVFDQNPGQHLDSHTVIEAHAEVVDEVRDMEVAKLMSLGYSIDRANSFYEKGLLYDDVVAANVQKNAQRLSQKPSQRVPVRDNSESFGSLFEGTAKSDSLFSMASGLLNRGKQFVDQLTNFPDEQDRMSRGVRNREEPSVEGKGYADLIEENEQGVSLNESLAEEALMDAFEETETELGPARDEILLDFNQNEVSSEKSLSPLPTIQISAVELSGYNEFKERASEFFKNGDYISALDFYEKSLNTLPGGHPLRIIAYSNITASLLKVGEYKKIIQDSETALALFPADSTLWHCPIQNSAPGRTFKDMYPKILIRLAEAFEYTENYQGALESYQLLINNSFFTDKVMSGKTRCQKMLNPQTKPIETKCDNEQKTKSVKTTVVKLNPVVAADKSYESVERLKEENRLERKIESEKAQLHDKVSARIETWKSDKGDDIRHLLAGLSSILTWCNWEPIKPSDLVMPRKVKIAYMKAVARTHPDKIPSSLELEQKMIAENIFTTLSIAWEKFRLDNDMT